MSYLIKRCPICNKVYHLHKNGRVTCACEHISVGRIRGKRTFLATADTAELDKMIASEHVKSKK